MWWKIILGIALFIVAAVGLCIFYLYRMETEIRRSSDAQLKSLDPRVLVGDGQFSKKVFCKTSDIGRITQIVLGGLPNRQHAALTLIGKNGIQSVDDNGELKEKIAFAKQVRASVAVVQLDRAGGYGFLNRDQSWAEDAILLDDSGNPLWSYGGRGGINDASVAEADQDGKSTFVVGFNGGGGIVLLNSQGKEIWRKPEVNVWHVESLDVDGDGRREILNSNARGQLLVRNTNGDVTNRYAAGHFVSRFSLTRWGSESNPTHILVPTTGAGGDSKKTVLMVLDATGKTVATLDAIEGYWASKSESVPIQRKTDSLFAVIQSGFLPRSLLSIYNSENKIIYREILGESCPALNAMPVDSSESLFVACQSSVWEYTPASASEH
jgi:hypothetical protein